MRKEPRKPDRPAMECWRRHLTDGLQEARVTLRGMRRRALPSAVIVATLALCLGANTVIFSLVHAVLLEPHPFADPDGLVGVFNSTRGEQDVFGVTAPTFHEVRRARAFGEAALIRTNSVNAAVAGSPRRLAAQLVTPSFFAMVGVAPLLGRVAEDEGDADDRVAVLSHGAWHRLYGGDPSALGQVLEVQGQPHTVIGVMPPDFAFLSSPTDIWLPLELSPSEAENYVWAGYWMFARLAPGATLALAEEQVRAIHDAIRASHPQARRVFEQSGRELLLQRYHEAMVGPDRRALVLLQAGVGLLLLIGLVNLANILLARARTRRRELAVRASLGA